MGAVTRALATLEGRSLFLLQQSARFMKVAALGADFIQVGTMTADFLTALDAILSQPGSDALPAQRGHRQAYLHLAAHRGAADLLHPGRRA